MIQVYVRYRSVFHWITVMPVHCYFTINRIKVYINTPTFPILVCYIPQCTFNLAALCLTLSTFWCSSCLLEIVLSTFWCSSRLLEIASLVCCVSSKKGLWRTSVFTTMVWCLLLRICVSFVLCENWRIAWSFTEYLRISYQTHLITWPPRAKSRTLTLTSTHCHELFPGIFFRADFSSR